MEKNATGRCYAMFDFMYCEQRRVNVEHGRGKFGVEKSILGHEKGSFGHGRGAFGAGKGHRGNFEQALGAMGRPKSKMLIFHWFYKVF